MDGVECHSSSSFARQPIALTWQGRRIEIERVLSEWYSPGERCFRVRTCDQRIFELTWNEVAEQWLVKSL